MKMSDYVVRAISADGQVRGFAAVTTRLVQELQRRHRTFPVASAALGRVATMGAIMGLTLKESRHRITLRVEGDGPLGRILVEADGTGAVRGMVDNPVVETGEDYKLNVGAAVGSGNLYVIKDLGLREPYRGTSPIISGELGDDFTYYFTVSEQVPSSVGLGVLVKREEILAAGGYLLQVMPDAAEETIERLEKQIGDLTSISELFNQGVTPEELLFRLMGEETQVLAKKEVRFQCRCSREKAEAVLRSLGGDELRSIRDELGKAEITCDFCNETYVFDASELERMLTETD
jgi:molecular chaperone Hsp33